MQVTDIIQKSKTKYIIKTDALIQFPLYKRELNFYNLETGTEIDDVLWSSICNEVLFLRAKKRAMHLLEQMDRTEAQLRRKLKENDYPEEVVDVAVAYVASFHYIDDLRYAQTYIRYHQDSKNRMQLTTALMQKGVSKDLIMLALEEELTIDENEMIQKLLAKKKYDKTMDLSQKQKIYAYLLRKGYSSEKVKSCMEHYETPYLV